MNRSHPRPLPARSLLAASIGLLVVVGSSACTQGSAPSTNSSGAGKVIELPPGSTFGDGFDYFIGDSHKGGDASSLKIGAVVWGRLVDVFALDPASGQRQKLFRDLLVDPLLESDPQDYLLELNPVTLREELTIRHAFGSAEFDKAFDPLRRDEGLQPFLPKGISPGEFPPFTMVPRNAAVAILLDDLLEPDSISRENVVLLVGYPPTAPKESRIIPDRCHGALLGDQLYSTRVIIDLAVSESEAQAQGIAANPLGLPAAINSLQPNGVVRIPTKVAPTAAQFSILHNLSGHGLSFTGNGPADAGSPTFDVLRGFRSGGPTKVTQDPYEGFLQDKTAPQVIGSQRVLVSAIVSLPDAQFELDVTFSMPACAIPPRPGDLIQVGNGVMRVVQEGDPLVGGVATDVVVERADDVFPAGEPPIAGVAEFKTRWDPSLGLLPACFVRFSPEATAPPGEGVLTSATITLSFSEPMNPEQTEAFDGLQLSDPSVPASSPLKRTVVGVVDPSSQLTTFVFKPSLPLSHTTGQTETYHLDVVSGTDPNSGDPFGVTDLAGNPLAVLLPQVAFKLEPTQDGLQTGGISLRFSSSDENGDGNPEIRGQLVPNFGRGVIQPRGLVRFSGFADITNQAHPVVQALTPVGAVNEPLSIYGSRTMTVWRYHDLNVPFYDDQYFNIDVEGMAWMVAGTGVQLDTFPAFQLGVAHSRYLPDEFVSVPPPPGSPFLAWPNSGVVTTFSSNLLDPTQDPYTILAPKGNGYAIQPLDSFKTPSGTLMQPFPVNLGKPISQYTYWTWRDTGTLAVGGPNGGGVDTQVNLDTTYDGYYPSGSVPTIGLPILLDFRTYPAPTTAQGSNFLYLAAANTGGPNAGLPYFRIQSTGGILPNGQRKLIDPDQELTAQGGLDAAGNPTPPTDSGFYYGNVDFVTRVNRIHTIWFDTGNPSGFGEFVTIPRATDVPAGTQMLFAFRGGTAITALGPAQDGNNLDPYGDKRPQGQDFSVTFLNGDRTWKPSLTQLDGARYVQARVTMVNNAETGAGPELSAIGFPYFLK